MLEPSWTSILPFLLVIPVAILFREILPGLVAGLFVGAFLLQTELIGGLTASLTFLINNLADEEHVEVILFLYLFGSLIGLMQITGGIKGFVQWVTNTIQSEKAVLFFVWLTIPFTFITPMFRIMLLGPVMSSIIGNFRIERKKMAYIIDVSTEPIVVLLPIATAFVGFMTSVVEGALEQNEIQTSAYEMFLASLPFNYFAIVVLFAGLVTTFLNFRGQKERLIAKANEGEGNQLHRLGIRKELELVAAEPLHLFFPLVLLLFLTFLLLWMNGQAKGATGIIEALTQADAMFVMVLAVFLTLVLSLLFYLFRRQPLKELIYHIFDGGNQLMMPITILALVWAVSSIAEELGFSNYISTTFGGMVSGNFVPALVFLFGSFISYFIGTSWGTWGLFMPLGVTLATATEASLPITVGAVFASGTFGAFASPLGDTTVTTASIMDLDVMEYAKYKLKISLLCGGLAFVGYLLTPFLLY